MGLKSLCGKVLAPAKRWLLRELTIKQADDASRLQLQIGSLASNLLRSRTTLPELQAAEFKVSSQFGEDGILDWLVERVNIPRAARSFIEFGVEDYREANTRFLLQNRNWRGLLFDGSPDVVRAVTSDKLMFFHDIKVQVAFITRENINELIRNAGFEGEIGVLSVDIDGNDYWVWDAISVVRPILCVCEYNAVFGDIYPLTVPYTASFRRREAHFSLLYAGASIAALRHLGERKGYCLIGTNSAGNNAFFVRKDYADRILDGSLSNVVSLPSKFRESLDSSGACTFVSGLERPSVIADLPLVNVATGEITNLAKLGKIYSDQWLEIMTGSPASGLHQAEG